MDSSSECLVSKEQETLETFFWHLGQFAYEKGKDVVEKEKEAYKSHQVHSIYGGLMSSLSQLALAEKNYSALLFLVPKGFLRKDSSLKSMYEVLLAEFQRLEERSNSNTTPTSSPPLSLTPPSTFYSSPASGGSGSTISTSTHSQISDELEKLASHLSGQLAHFVIARLGMMEFYEKMWSMSSMQFMRFDELLANITEIINAKQKLFHHPYLSPIKSSFNYECEILHQLLKAHLRIEEWQFLPSLLHLHDAHSKLGAWAAPSNSKECAFSNTDQLSIFSCSLQWNSHLFPDTYNIQLFVGKKYPSYSISRPLTVPPLYHWLCKLKSALVSKFTLYFYKTLSQQTSSSEMKSLCSHATTDYYQKIVSFQKRTDAYCVALVLNTIGLESYRGHGYQYPNKPYEPPKGLDSYPAILSYPIEQPMPHWPCIVMIMNDKSWETRNSDDVMCFYDKNLQTTYYLARIDQHMTVVVIIQSKRPEKEGHINSFLHELCIQLRCNKVFASLKPGSK